MIAHISEDGLNREQSVAEHTAGVFELCSKKGSRLGISNIMKICALFHDMGKEKKEFETYIRGDAEFQKRWKGKIDHSTAGAKYIYERYCQTGKQVQKIFSEILSCVIASHHGLFDCVEESKKEYFYERMNRVQHYEEVCENAGKELFLQYDLDALFGHAEQEFQTVFKHLLILSGNNREKLLFYLSCLNRLFLSILIDSDWEDTARFMNNADCQELDFSFIFQKASESFAHYMEETKQSFESSSRNDKERKIYQIRNDIQEECREFAKYSSGIYCLPIPTGGGKTLSGLAYALEFAKKHPQTERIFYIAPYISVIEQNADIIRRAVGGEKWVLEHHSNVVQESGGYEQEQITQLDITWEEPFVCTTFVQFMNTLFSDRKQSVRRMHRLINSVIIIDEVQAMPLKCIYTFNCMMNFLEEICHADIILCTATQPVLDDSSMTYPIQYSEPKNMIGQLEHRFRQFERVDIILKTDRPAYRMEELETEIREQVQKYPSILVVLNTKSAVKNLYDLLAADCPDEVQLEYLTTNLCAAHRSRKLDYIKEGLRNTAVKDGHAKKWIVVSTNLIEAGVDLSFACVYRSIAGLDSIAQTAGRCNRNGELEKGVIYVVDVENEGKGSLEELQIASRASREIMQVYDKKESLLSPYWMHSFYKRYYFPDEQKNKMYFPVKSQNTNVFRLLSYGFVNKSEHNILNQAYRSAGRAYQIIDTYSVGVIVSYDQGKEIIDRMQQTRDAMEMKELIRSAQRYTVNIPEYRLRDFMEQGIIFSCSEYFPDVYILSSASYHDETGFTGEMGDLIL